MNRIVAGEPCGALEVGNERIERAVLVVRQAEIAQAGMGLGFNVRRDRSRKPRLTDARLAADQHHTSFSSFHLSPATEKQFDLLLSPNERHLSRAQGVEPVSLTVLAQHQPSALRLSEASKWLRPEVLEIEQLSDLLPRAEGNDQTGRCSKRLQP